MGEIETRRPRGGGAGLAEIESERTCKSVAVGGQGSADAAAPSGTELYRLWIELEPGVRKLAFGWTLFDRSPVAPDYLSDRAWASFSSFRAVAACAGDAEINEFLRLCGSKSRVAVAGKIAPEHPAEGKAGVG